MDSLCEIFTAKVQEGKTTQENMEVPLNDVAEKLSKRTGWGDVQAEVQANARGPDEIDIALNLTSKHSMITKDTGTAGDRDDRGNQIVKIGGRKDAIVTPVSTIMREKPHHTTLASGRLNGQSPSSCDPLTTGPPAPLTTGPKGFNRSSSNQFNNDVHIATDHFSPKTPQVNIVGMAKPGVASSKNAPLPFTNGTSGPVSRDSTSSGHHQLSSAPLGQSTQLTQGPSGAAASATTTIIRAVGGKSRTKNRGPAIPLDPRGLQPVLKIGPNAESVSHAEMLSLPLSFNISSISYSRC